MVALGAAVFCVAGVALGDIDLRFAWQAWHLATFTFVLCGRRGICGTGLGLATRLGPLGVALGDIHVRFVRQAWHLRHRAGSGDALGSAWSTVTPRRVAGAWHLRHWAGSGDALGSAWSLVMPRLFCGAGAAFGHIHFHFVWQAWRLVISTFLLCGRRGTYSTGLGLVARLGPLGRWSLVMPRLFCVAGVAFGDTHFCFVWQAWPMFVLCGRRGPYGTGLGLVTRLGPLGRL
eukprot:s1322_g14.t1